MSNRESIQQSIAKAAAEAVARQQPVDVDELALRLSTENPQSGMVIGDIVAELRRALSAAEGKIAA